jgi:hypothetical protein
MSNLYEHRDADWYKTGIDALVDFGANLHSRGLENTVINTVFGTYTSRPRDTTDYRTMWISYLKRETLLPEHQRALAELIREVQATPIMVGNDT